MREIITQLQPGREGGRQGSGEREGRRDGGQRGRGCKGDGGGGDRGGWRDWGEGQGMSWKDMEGLPLSTAIYSQGLGDWMVGTWEQLETAGCGAVGRGGRMRLTAAPLCSGLELPSPPSAP